MGSLHECSRGTGSVPQFGRALLLNASELACAAAMPPELRPGGANMEPLESSLDEVFLLDLAALQPHYRASVARLHRVDGALNRWHE